MTNKCLEDSPDTQDIDETEEVCRELNNLNIEMTRSTFNDPSFVDILDFTGIFSFFLEAPSRIFWQF